MEYLTQLQTDLNNNSEKEHILARAGISSTARINDLASYLPVWTRTNTNNLNQLNDFELLDKIPVTQREGLQSLTTRQELIDRVRTILTGDEDGNYDACLKDAQKRYDAGKLKLCPRGYCTAKLKFEVYPSAYANGYAVQVCKGTQPDFNGQTANDYEQTDKPEDSDLARWYQEQWVNICSYNAETGQYAPCGRKSANLTPENYPYCRPLNKLPGTTVKTVSELTEQERVAMCAKKQSLPQGVGGKPTRVYL